MAGYPSGWPRWAGALGLLMVSGSVGAVSHCDPYDELRCTRGYDWQNCRCIGEGERQPSRDPCQTIGSANDASQCMQNRIASLARDCQAQGRGWTPQRLDYWDQLVDLNARWGLPKLRRPRECD